MDEPADVSSENRPGRHLLDEGFSTRNRKVEGFESDLELQSDLELRARGTSAG
jgi:hypothetical protein